MLAAVSASPAAISSRMRAVEARRVADHLEADAVLVELRDLLLERAQEQLHQDRDLVGGAAPVLAREREQRQDIRRRARCTRGRSRAPPRRPCGGRRRAAACRCFAQRPLPSMMIATCRGTRGRSGMSRVELVNMGGMEPVARWPCVAGRRPRPSDRHQVGFLRRAGPCRSRRCSGR